MPLVCRNIVTSTPIQWHSSTGTAQGLDRMLRTLNRNATTVPVGRFPVLCLWNGRGGGTVLETAAGFQLAV